MRRAICCNQWGDRVYAELTAAGAIVRVILMERQEESFSQFERRVANQNDMDNIKLLTSGEIITQEDVR